MTLSESIVQVLQDGKLLTSFKTDQNGSYNVYLPLGSDYLISISKNNYVQKYFSVSTKGIPQDRAGVKLPAIKADVDLFKYYDANEYNCYFARLNSDIIHEKNHITSYYNFSCIYQLCQKRYGFWWPKR